MPLKKKKLYNYYPDLTIKELPANGGCRAPAAKAMNKFLALFDRHLINKEIAIRIPVKVPIKAVITILLMAYLAWELYWRKQVGWSFIKWHTHLMPFAYIWFSGILLFQFWNRRNSSEKVLNFFLLFNAVILSLVILEAFFVISGIDKTYSEEEKGVYISPYDAIATNYYNTCTPGEVHWLSSSEYSYPRKTNSMGYADEEWAVFKKPGEKRLLALGDSYTEGDGAPYDSSYVALLRQELKTAGDSFYVMNGGVCGSDPFYNYISLKDNLLKYKPDIVIQSVRSIDLRDYFDQRGGLERFQKDGTVKYRNPPWWENIYTISYISRPFCYLGDFLEPVTAAVFPQFEKNEKNRVVRDLLGRYSSLCNANGIRLVIVLHPNIDEVKKNKYKYDLLNLLQPRSADNHIKVIDLMPLYTAYIEKNHSNLDSYFWKRNPHHNASGYKMMADIIFENLKPLLNDSTITMNH